MVSGYDAFRSVYIFHGPLRERALPISFQPMTGTRRPRYHARRSTAFSGYFLSAICPVTYGNFG